MAVECAEAQSPSAELGLGNLVILVGDGDCDRRFIRLPRLLLQGLKARLRLPPVPPTRMFAGSLGISEGSDEVTSIRNAAGAVSASLKLTTIALEDRVAHHHLVGHRTDCRGHQGLSAVTGSFGPMHPGRRTRGCLG